VKDYVFDMHVPNLCTYLTSISLATSASE